VSERHEQQVVAIARRLPGGFGSGGVVKPALPRIEARLPLGRRLSPLIRNIVSDPGERIDGGDVRPHPRRQQP
jgi:hypothetical protein